MSTPLDWTQVSPYCLRAGEYTICKIGSAEGWTYEVWKGHEQLKVGLGSADRAKAWCQRHHDDSTGEIHADTEQASLLAGH